ncbi:MAG: M28 family peptidase, partial [Promethearchaeota archaeon]
MSGNENEKSNNNEFNKEKLRKIVEELAFPRLTGSDGAKKAVDYCKSLFKEIDINLNSEKFYATKFYVGALLQGVAVLAIILTILMTYLFVSYIPYNLIILFIVLGILAALAPKIGGSGELKPIGKKIETENLWASIPAKKERTGYIILMGHHDSKSQTLSTVQRSASYVFLFVGLIFMILVQLIYGLIALVSLLRNTSFILPNWVKIANYIFAAITILSSIPLMLNFLGNKSPGALDNASSVAVLYELARVLRENPLENYEVIIVITGAEELGMIGAREFV